jgi:hypothetical protein
LKQLRLTSTLNYFITHLCLITAIIESSFYNFVFIAVFERVFLVFFFVQSKFTFSNLRAHCMRQFVQNLSRILQFYCREWEAHIHHFLISTIQIHQKASLWFIENRVNLVQQKSLAWISIEKMNVHFVIHFFGKIKLN